MPLPDITPLPPAPQRTDPPELFNQKADAFVAALGGMVAQMNAFATELEVAASLLAAAPAYADPGLKAMTGNAPAADRIIYFTGANSSALTALTAVGRQLAGAVDKAGARGVLELGSAALQGAEAFDASGAAAAVGGALSAHMDDEAGAHGISLFGAGLVAAIDSTEAREILGAVAVAGSDLDNAGFIRLDNGFQIKWGATTVAANGTTAVAYPTAFTSWSKALAQGVGEFTTGQAPTQVQAINPTAAGFDIFSGSENSFTAHWVAIGV